MSEICRFNNEPSEKNSIANLMSRIPKRAGLSQIYTAHCVRHQSIKTSGVISNIIAQDEAITRDSES